MDTKPSFAQQSDVHLENIKSLFNDDFEGVRDLLMFEMLYQTGVRSSELINLLDVRVSNNQIRVLGKRNKERIIPICPRRQISFIGSVFGTRKKKRN